LICCPHTKVDNNAGIYTHTPLYEDINAPSFAFPLRYSSNNNTTMTQITSSSTNGGGNGKSTMNLWLAGPLALVVVSSAAFALSFFYASLSSVSVSAPWPSVSQKQDPSMISGNDDGGSDAFLRGGMNLWRQRTPEQVELPPAILLPAPMDMIRRGFPVEQFYNFKAKDWTGACSCENATATSECCKRTLFRGHKMGTVLTNTLFSQYDIELQNRWYNMTYVSGLPEKQDYRDILLYRNIWESIVSGYKFHLAGQECSHEGYKGLQYLSIWNEIISYELVPPKDHRDLCRYLQQTEEEQGMRAYVRIFTFANFLWIVRLCFVLFPYYFSRQPFLLTNLCLIPFLCFCAYSSLK